MRCLLLLAALVLAPALASAATSWNQVLLFDWVYPGESSYTLLQNAARQSGDAGWLYERFNAQEKIPQASARELAGRLWDDERVDASTRQQLKEAFKDEPEQLSDGEGGLQRDRMGKLTAALDDSSRAIDRLQASLDTNRYGKGSTPAVNMEMYSAYRLDAPAGLLYNRSHAYLLGGMNATILGTLDKANFNLGLGTRYYFTGEAPTDDYSTLQGTYEVGASFQMPLGQGGLEVHLGDRVDVYLSSLLSSTISLKNKDLFYVDVTKAFRTPDTAVRTMDLDYPAFTTGYRGLYIRRQGSEWFWPFSLTQVLYAQQFEYYETFRAHVTTADIRLDEDFSGIFYWLEGFNLYGLLHQSGNDADNLVGIGFTTATAVGAKAQGGGWDIRLSTGTELRGEVASSLFESKDWGVAKSLQTFEDSAWINVLKQPLGPLNLAFEAGAAGPRYLTSPIPATDDRVQSGSFYNTILLKGDGFPGGSTDPNKNYKWLTLIKDPTVLTNNSQRMVLKAEFHLSWLSIGIYDGVIGQLEPSSSKVAINPYIEGFEFNGFGWYRMFGQKFGGPPGAGSNFPPNAYQYGQSAFNLPTASRAIYDGKGNSINVNWQELSQTVFKSVELTTILSEGGVGDRRILKDSLKTLNYAGTRLNFDFASILGLDLPLDLTVLGEVRDLAVEAGLPTLGTDNFINQQIAVAFLRAALTQSITLLGLGGYETWKSQHSFYPLDMQVREVGAGLDWKLDPVVTGLQFNLRATLMNFDDLNVPSRALSLETVNAGCTLTY